MAAGDALDIVRDYLKLGLALGRHIDGLVDAYYGPPELSRQVIAEPLRSPAELAEQARRLLADLEHSDRDLDSRRRRYLAAQVEGLRTTAAKLSGEPIRYVDEVEAGYGVRPTMRPEDELAAAHRQLDEALPGSGSVRERYINWREAQVVPVGKLRAAVASLAEDLRERTARLWGLPEGEHVDFDLVSEEPWSGFNYYLGDLHSRVAINTDLPVLSTGLGHLVAHEAYPGHHTEHSRKEAGLVRRRDRQEETIFLVGTPQCLLAEGLADLGLEVAVGPTPETMTATATTATETTTATAATAVAMAAMVASHLQPLGIPYDADLVAAVSTATEVLGAVRGNAALLLHDRGVAADDVLEYLARWGLQSHQRAEKGLEFLANATWRAYIFCYVEGLPLCRRFVNGDPARFERLISEQLIPADLVAG